MSEKRQVSCVTSNAALVPVAGPEACGDTRAHGLGFLSAVTWSLPVPKAVLTALVLAPGMGFSSRVRLECHLLTPSCHQGRARRAKSSRLAVQSPLWKECLARSARTWSRFHPVSFQVHV